jgi:hypothetical protein
VVSDTLLIEEIARLRAKVAEAKRIFREMQRLTMAPDSVWLVSQADATKAEAETASYVKDTQAARDLDADAKKLEKEAKQVTAYVIGIVVLSIAVLWGVMR